jgi:glutaredoxin 3
MSEVLIYTKQGCPYSERARELLDEKGIPYEEVDITGSPELEAEMVQASGGRSTTPQIIIDGEPLGGASDLEEADRGGRLASMLTLESNA